jgi:alpha-1,3-mannosyl-glycoprotein beta-1,2-N-acetylglucosaminyltransferase
MVKTVDKPNAYFALSEHFNSSLHGVFLDRSTATGTVPGSKGPSDASGNPWALLTGLSPRVARVIILEEDLEIAPDFFSFFGAVRPMLDADTSLLAASAFNDNGFGAVVRDNKQLYRSDFFPGLGWMMPRRVWEELAPKWPKAYWDDWLREPPQRKGRHMIRPEVCRTFHYGELGASSGQFKDALKDIRLNTEAVDFAHEDLSYLAAGRWEEDYLTSVMATPLIKRDQLSPTALEAFQLTGARLTYSDARDFVRLSNMVGVMDNIKAGVPRTAYRGVVSLWRSGTKLHLVPRDGPSTHRLQ